MRPTKKADRALAGLSALMSQYGVKAEVIEEVQNNVPSTKDAKSRQGEAVLLFLESPAKFTAKLCKRCGEAFGTNYRAVGYCSDSCRSKQISEQLGVKWDWMRADETERWGGEPPLIIPPVALRKIQQFVEWFADNVPTQSQTQSHPESLDLQNSDDAQLPHTKIVYDSISQQLEDNSHTNRPVVPGELPTQHTDPVVNPFDF